MLGYYPHKTTFFLGGGGGQDLKPRLLEGAPNFSMVQLIWLYI